MLRNILFYASLLDLPLSNGKKATVGHVLVYGAIEAHDLGPKGCIASNQGLSRDTGLSTGRVANILSELNSAEWIYVSLNEKNQRHHIEPLASIHIGVNHPSRVSEPPLHADVNIDNKENTGESADAVDTLFFDLAEKLGMARRPVLTSTRRAKLKARLKNFTPLDLIEVALTISKDEFMQGKNDGGKKYGTIDYLIRNDEKIEYWINEAMSAKANGGDLSEQFAGKTGTRSAALDKLKGMS